MSGPPPTRLAASVALFEQSARYALAGLSGITAADLAQPTPCAGWDLHALLLHLADSADALAGLMTGGSTGLATPPPPPGDAVAAAGDRTRQLLGALSSAREDDMLCQVEDRVLWASTAARVGAIEFAAHGWDISAACRTYRPIPAGLAGRLLELAPLLITDLTRRPEFGPPSPVPAGADPSDRLVGFLGRRPPPRE
jgi:uncharacterized protein (TIGR03086 family)